MKHNYNISRFFIDFIIENYKLLIELDGNYWHDETSQEARIIKKVERDKRLNALCNKQNVHLFRLKESELCHELNLSRKKLPRHTKVSELLTESNAHKITELINDVLRFKPNGGTVHYREIRP